MSCRLWILPAAWVSFSLAALSGCGGRQRLEPEPPLDHFGAEFGDPITEESVSETQMLGRRTQLQLFSRAYIPVESDFEVAGGVGLKAEIEVAKNLYMGMSFDWLRMFTKDRISDIDNPGELLSAEPAQLFSKLDRYNFLFLFDYDIPLARHFLGDDRPLNFRLGTGVGMLYIDGDAAESDFISSFDIEPYAAFLLRPSLEFVWAFSEVVHLSLGMSYDFTPEGTIDIEFLGERSEVDEDINFSTFNVGAGLVFEW
jgi:hypothetical protein